MHFLRQAKPLMKIKQESDIASNLYTLSDGKAHFVRYKVRDRNVAGSTPTRHFVVVSLGNTFNNNFLADICIV